MKPKTEFLFHSNKVQAMIFTWQDHRHDICHKHHKQCLCKLVSTPGKISEMENFFSVNSKTFVLLLVKKVQILRELLCLMFKLVSFIAKLAEISAFLQEIFFFVGYAHV